MQDLVAEFSTFQIKSVSRRTEAGEFTEYHMYVDTGKKLLPSDRNRLDLIFSGRQISPKAQRAIASHLSQVLRYSEETKRRQSRDFDSIMNDSRSDRMGLRPRYEVIDLIMDGITKKTSYGSSNPSHWCYDELENIIESLPYAVDRFTDSLARKRVHHILETMWHSKNESGDLNQMFRENGYYYTPMTPQYLRLWRMTSPWRWFFRGIERIKGRRFD